MKEVKTYNWKTFFLLLLTINIIFFVSILVIIFIPDPGADQPEKVYIEEEGGADFTIRSSKEKLNELVNAYINQLPNPSNIKYTINFHEEVLLMGSVDAFSTEVPVNISFEPLVQDNGDIILQASGMSLGLLRLPEDRILQYVNSRVELPNWITINPKEEQIYVALTQMDLKSNFRVRAH